MSIIRFKPSNENLPVFSNFFNNFLGYDLPSFFENEFSNTIPAVNFIETKEEFKLELAAPGLKKEDFKVKVDENVLTIKAETEFKKAESDDKIKRREFNYSKFIRTFTLPKNIELDKIDALYNNGILSISIPKKEEFKLNNTRDIQIL